jgi:hypothetical protein
MANLKKIWRWIKVNWKIVALSVIAIAIVVAYTLSEKGSSSLEKKLAKKISKKKIEIIKNKKDIAYLVGKRDEILNRVIIIDDDLDLVNKRIKFIKNDIKKTKTEINKLTIEKKLARFERLGY